MRSLYDFIQINGRAVRFTTFAYHCVYTFNIIWPNPGGNLRASTIETDPPQRISYTRSLAEEIEASIKPEPGGITL